MISVSCELDFCCAHRLLGHESKCAQLHGHNYILRLCARGKKLDRLGRVVDFTVLKKRMNDWIDSNWDHGLLLYTEDKKMMALAEQLAQLSKIYYCSFNPTAENMALHLLHVIAPSLFAESAIEVYRIELAETARNTAIADLLAQ